MIKKIKDLFYRFQHKIKLIWIEIRYAVEEWILKKTARIRIKYSKKLILSSHAYFDWTGDYKHCWDDVDVSDQWGFWLPLGFGIASRLCWEEDNKFNAEYGYPLEPWKDVEKNENWWTYNTQDEYLEAKHYFMFGKKHLLEKVGDEFKDKDVELKLKVTSERFIEEQKAEHDKWVAEGKPKFKVEFAGSSKEDFKKILGEEEAQQLFDETEKRNKEIDAENESKKQGENKETE